ncbi:undecaprenyl-diphosphatase [Pullulanibacillus pueri]|uniref:Phosphatidylglycerophosphatase B n=1 Tax=Pullulanibacillus pueri TaxID=1437324 RepID=A0A8J2ZSQ9_9BACL|nr:phosphatase PAP2 family protein [Pullulanibacillus pueri]MBM7680306.1 undecaprenyl-diphosphatase [Pullulanibacillus pueri]GGH75734.1 phosphatidylglycerophosphatase B [Pullulanibacillus pueri]
MNMLKTSGLFCVALVLFSFAFFLIGLHYYDPLFLHFNAAIQSRVYNALGKVGLYIFTVITYIGSIDVSLPLTLLLSFYYALRKHYGMILLLFYNLESVRIVNGLLKNYYKVPRPTLTHLVHAGSYSFPSGHSMNSLAFFGFLTFLLSVNLKRKGRRTGVIWTSSCLLIFLIGLSRVYLGVHFPMDIIGGYLAGLACLMMTLLLYTVFSSAKASASNS